MDEIIIKQIGFNLYNIEIKKKEYSLLIENAVIKNVVATPVSTIKYMNPLSPFFNENYSGINGEINFITEIKHNEPIFIKKIHNI